MTAVKCLPVVLVVVLLVACGGGGTPDTKPRRAVEAERVEAADLCQQVRADWPAARRRWEGKTVELAGNVHAAYAAPQREEGAVLKLTTDDDRFLAIAGFHRSRTNEVVALRQGQSVKLCGVITDVGYSAETREVLLFVEDCALVK